MIVVAGLTPAWQQILRFRRLDLGEVNRAAEVVRCASGKVLNVGLALTALGAECRTISPVGGPAQQAFDAEFAEIGVAVDWIRTKSPTRLCTTLLDDATGKTTELVENAGPLAAEELAEYRATYSSAAAQAEVTVFTGSLPAGVDASFYRELADVTTGRIVADIRGPELLSLLEGERTPFLVKPNREELGATVGRSLNSDSELHAAMRELNDRGAEWVVVTQGKDAVWASSHVEGLWRFSPPRPERVVNPIGCGDCFCAGVAAGLAREHEVVRAIAMGMGAAVDNLRSLLPARLDTARVAALANQVAAERIK